MNSQITAMLCVVALTASAQAPSRKAGETKPQAANTPANAGKPPLKEPDRPLAGEVLLGNEKSKGDVVLNFSNARLLDVVQQIARICELNYTLDPAVKDVPIRLYMNGPLDRNGLLDILGLAVKLHGIAMVRNGDFLEFAPLQGSAIRAATPLFYGARAPEGVGESMVVTQMVPLKFVDTDTFGGFAKEFMSRDGSLTADKARNLLVIIDYMQNVRRILDFVNLLDRQPFEQKKIHLFRLTNAVPEQVIKELEPILKAMNIPVGTASLQILPLQSLNALLVITGSNEWIPDLKAWLERFDESPHTEEGELFVLPLRHAKVDALYPILNQVLRLHTAQGQGGARPTAQSPVSSLPTNFAPLRTPGSPFQGGLGNGSLGASGPNASSPAPLGTAGLGTASQPQTLAQPLASAGTQPPSSSSAASSPGSLGPLSPGASMTMDLDSNSLVIFGTKRDFALIESAVKKLDQMPRQVLIEATILDISLTGDFQFGFSGYLKSHFDPSEINVNGVSGASFSRDSRIDRPDATSAFTYTGMASTRFGLVKAILTAQDTRANAKLISQPMIWAIDNKTSKFLIQNQIPIAVNTFIPGSGTGTGSSGYSITNVQYLDTGLSLMVTPHINGSGVVRLELQQEISSSLGAETLGSGSSAISAPKVSRRTLVTELITPNDTTVILGGLITHDRNEDSNGFPLLNRIPVLKHLFSSQRRVTAKSELVILLTPHVVVSGEDLESATKEIRDRVNAVMERPGWLETLFPTTPINPKVIP